MSPCVTARELEGRATTETNHLKSGVFIVSSALVLLLFCPVGCCPGPTGSPFPLCSEPYCGISYAKHLEGTWRLFPTTLAVGVSMRQPQFRL